MKKKIDARLKKLVLNQHRNNPNLGVRKLSDLLEKKYGVLLSKSSVHSVLQAKGAKLKKGRKEAKLAYEKNSIPEAGLLLLRCIDSQIGFFEYVSDELNIYTPKLKKELLKKFIILASLAFLSAEKPNTAARKKSYLRLAGLYRFPVKKFNYFKKQIVRYQPTLELKLLHKNLTIISGIKIIFIDRSYIFSDAKMTTLWDSVPKIEYFFSSLQDAKNRVMKMAKEGLFIFGYTKSWGHLSTLVFKLIKGQKQRIAAVQFLDTKAKVVEKIEMKKKTDFILGYYPKGVSKGLNFPKKQKRYKCIHLTPLGTYYLLDLSIEFIQNIDNERIISNNVLIRDKNYGLPNWGLITSYQKITKTLLKDIINSYLYLWPDREESFFAGTKAIEQSFFNKDAQKKEIMGILPHKLSFSQLTDFSRVGQLLSILCKELVEGFEPKRKRGFIENGNDYLLVVLDKIAAKTKKRLNKQAFFVDGKRVFFR